MKQFTIGFTHSGSPMRLTETVTAESSQYARLSIQGRYKGVQILSISAGR